MTETLPTVGYLFVPDLLGPPDQAESDLLAAAGAEPVYVDWGSRSYRSLLMEQEGLAHLLLRRVEDLGDSVEEIRAVLVALREAGVAIRLVDDRGTPIPENSHAWIETMADLPGALQRRRALQHHVRNRLEAKPPPGAAPYGYRREQDRYVLVRKQAAVVKDFFEHFLLYGSLRSSVRHLRQHHGKAISVSTGRRWLTHPVYRGDLAFADGTVLRNTHSPILSRQEAAQIDRWLRRNRQLSRRSASAPRSLAGLVTCRRCGSTLQIVQTTARKGRSYLYLRCPECRYSLSYETILQTLIQQICEQLPQRTRDFDLSPLEQVRTGLEAQLAKNETILKQLSDLEGQGLLDGPSLQQRRYQLHAENTLLLQQMDQLPPQNLVEIAKTLSIQPFWQDLTEVERRSYFREFIRSLSVDATGQLSIQFVF